MWTLEAEVACQEDKAVSTARKYGRSMHKTTYHNEEVHRTEPPPSLRFPCIDRYK
jgi:hypothetical protein